MVRQKYLSTTEMVTGFERKTNNPIQQITPQPGDSRVYRPTKYDVLCGRGAPIQNHEGNVRMRRLVSRYTKRYMDSRKYRKQLVAEEAVRRVKRAAKGVTRARFLRRVGRENYWEEVDDRIASDKVSHALRCFVRKLEEGNETLVSDNEDDSSVGETESDTEEVPSSVSQESKAPTSSVVSSSALEKSASGVEALKRTSPIHTQPLGLTQFTASLDPLFGSHSAFAGMLPPSSFRSALGVPGMLSRLVTPPVPSGIGSSGHPISAAEAELDYRMKLQRLSTRGLMDLVAAERSSGAPPTDPLASSLTSSAYATARMEQQLLHQRILNRARMAELLTKEHMIAAEAAAESPKEVA
ncbi:unnamed protein product [Cylindrotheca closterium]|uniref:DUF6824 domain-containing protein n=1 Tax=Cylindrotheca closterium TaxID=2856 RepID=A0AAD2GCM0_9STRA|nr:unnamed protein product [Cylindrotheca closterium]